MNPKKTIAMLFLCTLTACAPAPAPSAPVSTPSMDQQDDVFAQINAELDAFLNDGNELPKTTVDGRSINWSVSKGHAYIEDGILYKDEDAEEYEPIELMAAVADEPDMQFNNLLLLDPYVSYLISYFNSDTETLKLAYTFDCTYWIKFYEDQTILAPSIGSKRLRDPSIIRKKDGTFFVVATQGYDYPDIYVYDSKDMTSFENERLLKLNRTSSSLKMSETDAWAPEGFYDRILDQYVLTFSSKPDGGMFYNLSDDLITCSDPVRLFDPGYLIIDGSIYKDGSTYYMVYKDEAEPMEEHTQLFLAEGEHWSSLSAVSDSPIIDRHQLEGPTIMKSFDNGHWFIAADDYTRKQYKIMETTDLVHGDYVLWDNYDLMLPFEDPAHCSAIPITWKETKRLMDYYGG